MCDYYFDNNIIIYLYKFNIDAVTADDVFYLYFTLVHKGVKVERFGLIHKYMIITVNIDPGQWRNVTHVQFLYIALILCIRIYKCIFKNQVKPS